MDERGSVEKWVDRLQEPCRAVERMGSAANSMEGR